jgi:deazaflavin-dependent oxidoreductase (nitroreductase family)
MIDMNEVNRQVIDAFRTNGGKGTGRFESAPLLLLTSTGAKTGQPRTTPLIYATESDRLVIIASKGGAPTHPDWHHNLLANPEVTVELGTEQFPARAEVAVEPERTRLFNAVAEVWPPLRQYQQNTERTIPVITLTRS